MGRKRGQTSMGRQKVEMKKIENEKARQVSFSKRRMGLFKKASELSIMCGAEIAVVAFSPAGKVFSFSQSNVDSVIDRFLSRDPGFRRIRPGPLERHRSIVVRDLNRQCSELTIQFEGEKAKHPVLEKRVNALTQDGSFPWVGDMEALEIGELERLTKSMCELRVKVDARMHELTCGTSFSNSALGVDPVGMVNPFGAIASSSNPVQEFNPVNPFGTMAPSSNPFGI